MPVVVDPGQAFGTGAHATTRLCLELLQEVPRGSLLDVGCGSGVLAIAGAKLGFAPVTALDVDPAAVAATEENARRNGVEVDVRLADALADSLPVTDVAVANITGEAVPWLPLSVARRDHLGLPRRPGRLSARLPERARRVRDGWAADLISQELASRAMATFSVRFLGCKVSHTDAQAVRDALLRDGHDETAGPADVAVVNTCCVTHEAVASRGRPRRAPRARTGAST